MRRWLETNNLGRGFLLVTLLLAITGCKLRITAPEGGAVVSASGAYSCSAGQKCTVDIVDVFFDENFLAQPAQGYYFRRWRSGERFFCADTYGSCRLATTFFAGNPILEQALESEEMFFLMPLFAEGTCETVRSETTDIFQSIFVEEGLKCTAAGESEAVYQGLVESHKNDRLVSVIGWDQGRMHGMAQRYHEDGLTIQETSHYQNGKYNGVQKTYDKQARLTLTAQWQEGQLDGKYNAYDYTDADLWNGMPVARFSSYKAGKVNGKSTTDYPNGVWEMRQWVDGVQEGNYEVFSPATPNSVNGWRYVYVLVEGLVRYGYAYVRYAVPGTTDKYTEEGGPDGPWIWPCDYVDGVLDEASCFRDGLDLGPRL